MEYMSAREAAQKWGISQRRVAVLCAENRIDNVSMLGNMWLIPKIAEKPFDARTIRHSNPNRKLAKPFLKWAGGKGQLIPEISSYYPFANGVVTKYAEPFVGGGAVLFDILNKYQLSEVYISDINAELINVYTTIRDNIDELVSRLKLLQSEFLTKDEQNRKIYYLAMRDHFNRIKMDKEKCNNIQTAALLIFLNKTCFNGLFRVNRKGLFNVPFGSYKNPLICDEGNLRSVSKALQNVTIVCKDYHASADFIDEHTFVYFDPPYRPINKTASFTSYTENQFDDVSQIELAHFASQMREKGALVVVSNSDPKNCNEMDNFFDDIYSSFQIKRVNASRVISCNSVSRGKIRELLISN